MGGDGGSIPGRADIIRVRGYGFKRNLGGMGYDPNTLIFVGDGKLSPDEARSLAFTRCHLSQEPFDPPIVVDRRGWIYNKEIVLSLLVDRQLPEEVATFISKAKDLCQIHPPSKHEGGTAAAYPSFDTETRRLQCQLTGAVCTGAGDYYANWKCGCLFSLKAAEEIYQRPLSATCHTCPVCSATPLDLVELVPKRLPELPKRKRIPDVKVLKSTKKIKAK